MRHLLENSFILILIILFGIITIPCNVRAEDRGFYRLEKGKPISSKGVNANFIKLEKKLHKLKEKYNELKKEYVVPVGTIVASMIEPENFTKHMDNKWVPADGRYIDAKSKYAELTKKKVVPDIRGMFLRGLNKFDGLGSSLPFERKDPDDNRSAGNYQPDNFTKHTHGIIDTGHIHRVLGQKRQDKKEYQKGNTATAASYHDDGNELTEKSEKYDGKTNIKIMEEGNVSETRPKNIAVYYYIRIN